MDAPSEATGDALGAWSRALVPARDEDGLPAPSDDVPFPAKGLLVGTWSVDPQSFGSTSWVDEERLRRVFTMERAQRRIWSGFQAHDSVLPLDRLLDEREGAHAGYLYALVMREDPAGEFAPERAVLHVKHKGRVQARLDGRVVIDAPASADGWADARAPVTLTGPYDVLLLKLGRGGPLGPSMNVSVRVSAPDGSALPGQGWQTMRPPGRPSDLDRPEWSGLDG